MTQLTSKKSKKLKSRYGTPAGTSGQRPAIEKLLMHAVEQSGEGVAVSDLEGNLLFVNRTCAEMHDYTPAELLGKNLSIFHASHQMPAVHAASLRLKQEGEFKGEIWHLRRDGRVFPCLMHNTLVRDSQGSPCAMMGTFIDISGYKQIEENLLLFRELVNQSHDAIFVVNPHTSRFIEANDAACSILGYQRSELLQAGVMDIALELGNLKRWHKHVIEVRQKGFLIEEFTGRNKNGSTFPVEVSIKLIQHAGSEYLIAAGRDISRRMQAENALRKSEKLFRAVAETSLDAIMIVDQQGTILYWNPSAQQLYGYTWDEIVGQDVVTLIPASLKSIHHGAWQRIRDNAAEPFLKRLHESTGLKKDGTEFPAEISLTGWHLDNQRLFSISLRDITVRKQAEQELRKNESTLQTQAQNLNDANAALKVLLHTRQQEEVRFQSQVLSNVKELIIPYLEKLKSSSLDTRQRTLLDIIESQLGEIIAPFSHRISSHFDNLTPSEIQVAGLVKEGKTSKEIADLLHSSIRSIEFHRNNLRRKLGIMNKKVNLRSYLLTYTGK